MNSERLEVVKVEISKLELKPNDIIVVKFDTQLTEYERDQLRFSMEDIFPGQRVIFMEGGMDLSIISPTDNENYLLET